MGLTYDTTVTVGFGSGKVLVRSAFRKRERVGVMVLTELEDAQEIGPIDIETADKETVKDSGVALTFTNQESIDVMIRSLKFLRNNF